MLFFLVVVKFMLGTQVNNCNINVTIFKVLKALSWDKVNIEVVMVELEHAGKVIFALLGFFDKATFCRPKLLKWCTFVSCKPLLFELSLSAVSGVSRSKTGCASIHARKRLRLCWITL